MYIFFLIINLVFAGVFYIHGNLIEAILFLFIWLLMCFYFSPMYFKNKWNKESVFSKFSISKQSIKNTIPLFQKASYLIAFFFFYLSLYGISSYFWNTLFPYFILILSLSVIILFLITLNKQKQVINLIFRYNFLVFSFIWMGSFIFKLFTKAPLDYVFMVNSILSFCWLILIMIFDKLLDNSKKKLFYIFFLIYLLFFLTFYIQYYFKINYLLFLPYLGFIMSIFYFDIIVRIKYLYFYDDVSKYFWVFLNYLTFIASGVLLFIFPNFWHLILILMGSIIFHYYVHYIFKNYISLVLILLGISLIYIKNFIEIWSFGFLPFLLFIYILPFFYLIYSFVVDNKYEYDNYFILFFWLAFSLISIIVYFFLYKDFNVLYISIIFLIQSFLLFWSFAKLRTK